MTWLTTVCTKEVPSRRVTREGGRSPSVRLPVHVEGVPCAAIAYTPFEKRDACVVAGHRCAAATDRRR